MASFSIDVGRWVDTAKDREDLVVRKVSIEAFRRVILKSPVDTGRFRANWQVAIGFIPDGTLELTDKTGQAAMSRATAAALQLRAGQVIYLVNNLPYARALEYGHSRQAPAGMVRVTVLEFNGIVRQAAQAAVNEKR